MHVTLRGCASAPGRDHAGAAAVASTSARTRAASSRCTPAVRTLRRIRRRFPTASRRAIAASRCWPTASRRSASRSSDRAPPGCSAGARDRRAALSRSERDRGYDFRGPIASPGRCELLLAARRRGHADRLDASRGTSSRAIDAGRGRARPSTGAAASSSDGPIRRLRRGTRRRAGAGRRSVRHHAAHARRRRGRALHARRRRGPHGHRRLPLVHRLGPRHDDQPRRADAAHRPLRGDAASILRTFAQHVRDGLIPNLFPEGAAEGLYHTADATLWFFHALDSLRAAHRRRATLRRSLAPAVAEIVEQHVRGHALRHRRRSARRPAAPGRGRLPADLDGRQGRRLGGDAAARQGGRDQRALVQRAPPAARAGRAPMATRRPRNASARSRRARVALVQRALLERRRRLPASTSSTARDATAHRSGLRPNQLFAISLPHPVLAPERWRARAGRGARARC